MLKWNELNLDRETKLYLLSFLLNSELGNVRIEHDSTYEENIWNLNNN